LFSCTAGRSLEGIHYTFDEDNSISKHIEYRVKKLIPWFFKRYILNLFVKQNRKALAELYGWSLDLGSIDVGSRQQYSPDPFYMWVINENMKQPLGPSNLGKSPAPAEEEVKEVTVTSIASGEKPEAEYHLTHGQKDGVPDLKSPVGDIDVVEASKDMDKKEGAYGEKSLDKEA
jgi:hypothetical protein